MSTELPKTNDHLWLQLASAAAAFTAAFAADVAAGFCCSWIMRFPFSF